MTNPYGAANAFADAIADVVEGLRWEKRISSVRKLAEAAGMTHTYLNARLNKAQPFNVEDLARLASVYGMSPNEIIDRAMDRMAELSEASFNLGAVASTETMIEPGDLEE